MIKNYKVFYDDVEIGILEFNEKENLYRYTPNKKGLNKVKDDLVLPVDLSTKTTWVKPIPFFANRIENCQRFQEETGCKVLGYQTDEYRLVLQN